MPQDFEKLIMERIDHPGWVTTRGVLHDPTGQAEEEDYRAVEVVMKDLAQQGKVTLWRLLLQDGEVELLAAARPHYELDKELKQREAWATAVRYEASPDSGS